jgi:RNA polymerase sigma factor (sigma-70 family)
LIETSEASVGSAGPRAASNHGFIEFFREAYRPLCAFAIFAGARGQPEAEDLVASAMEGILRRWQEIDNPLAYAHRAVVSNLIKEKTRSRGLLCRLQERGHAVLESDVDPAMTVWEDWEWVNQLVNSLPPAQREVLAFVVAGFKPVEIAGLLGKTPGTVRKNLQFAVHRLRSHEDLAQYGAVGSSREVVR